MVCVWACGAEVKLCGAEVKLCWRVCAPEHCAIAVFPREPQACGPMAVKGAWNDYGKLQRGLSNVGQYLRGTKGASGLKSEELRTQGGVESAGRTKEDQERCSPGK